MYAFSTNLGACAETSSAPRPFATNFKFLKINKSFFVSRQNQTLVMADDPNSIEETSHANRTSV